MADNKGWIKVHRKIFDCWVWKDKPYDKARAWIDLLLLAMHHDTKTISDNKVIDIPRGSYMTSILKLSERWGWSKGKTKRFINELESDSMLTTIRTNTGTLVTIVNYEVYQPLDDDSRPTNEPTDEPTNEPTDEPHNKELKNIKNENKGNKVSKDTFCAEPKHLATAPVFIEIPLNDGSLYSVLCSDVEEWKNCYPAVDVEQQLRSMKSWCNCNPAKRKTRKGVMRFIDNWLSKEQNKYHGNIPARQNMDKKTFDEEKFKAMNESKWQ